MIKYKRIAVTILTLIMIFFTGCGADSKAEYEMHDITMPEGMSYISDIKADKDGSLLVAGAVSYRDEESVLYLWKLNEEKNNWEVIFEKKFDSPDRGKVAIQPVLDIKPDGGLISFYSWLIEKDDDINVKYFKISDMKKNEIEPVIFDDDTNGNTTNIDFVDETCGYSYDSVTGKFVKADLIKNEIKNVELDDETRPKDLFSLKDMVYIIGDEEATSYNHVRQEECDSPESLKALMDNISADSLTVYDFKCCLKDDNGMIDVYYLDKRGLVLYSEGEKIRLTDNEDNLFDNNTQFYELCEVPSGDLFAYVYCNGENHLLKFERKL